MTDTNTSYRSVFFKGAPAVNGWEQQAQMRIFFFFVLITYRGAGGQDGASDHFTERLCKYLSGNQRSDLFHFGREKYCLVYMLLGKKHRTKQH